MRLLLDTHIVLWALADDPKLTQPLRDALDGAERLHVSSVSIWEITVKRALGKLAAPEGLTDVIRRTGMVPLAMTWAHAERAGGLPAHHADPFDRLLVAQAQVEGLSLVSVDRAIARYDVALVR